MNNACFPSMGLHVDLSRKVIIFQEMEREEREGKTGMVEAIRPTLRPTVSANAITQLNFQFSQTNAITSSNSALLFSNRLPPEFPKRKDGKVEGILASRGEKGGEASEFNRNFAALLDEKKIARITITQ